MKHKSRISATNTKKPEVKDILKDILYNSTAQAIFKITQTPHLTVKLFLLVCVVGSSGASSYFVIKSVLNYFSYEVNTITRKLFETTVKFPKVTICNYNQFTTVHALEFLKGINYNISPNISIFDENQLKKLTRQEKGDLIKQINRLAFATMLDRNFPVVNKTKFGHSIEDILLDCSFNNQKCTANDFSWTLDRHYGNCFIFNKDSNATTKRNSTIAGPVNGLKIVLYLNFHEKLTLLNSQTGGLGALVRIENNSYLNDHNDDGVYVPTGELTNIAVERTFRHNLPTPYSNCELGDEQTKDFYSDLYDIIVKSDYEYNQQFCFSQCVQKEIISLYNCSYPFSFSLLNSEQCINETKLNLTEAYYFKLISDSFLEDNCRSLCPLECNSTEYHVSVSSVQIIGDYYADFLKENPNLLQDFVTRPVNARTAQESVVVMNIFYDSLAYTKSTEIAQMDLVALLSNIGGTLSLFLGVSVFSLFEIVEVLFEIYINYRGK